FGRYGNRDLDRLAIGKLCEFQACHWDSPSAAVRPQHQILVNDDAQRPAGPDLDGWLDVEVLLRDLLTGLVDAVLRGFADRHQKIALTAQREFGADAKQC